MTETFRPETPEQLRDLVRWAAAEERPLALAGGGSKAGLGRPVDDGAARLDLTGFTGISLYEPEELVLSAGAGTPMAEIEGLLAQNRQQLAFEPADYGPLYGQLEGCGTIAGVLAANVSGPRRIKAGAARDHFLGFSAVTGRGDIVKSGGRVVKNVTGYDLCKLIAGSHGTLAALTAVTIKVLPAPEKVRTVLAFGLDDRAAVAALAEAAGTPHEVSGLAHLPAAIAARSAVAYVRDAGASVTAVRVEGPEPSVLHRCAALRRLLGHGAGVEELHGHNSGAFWRQVRDVAELLPDSEAAIWRLSVPPTAGPEVAAGLDGQGGSCFYDWSGGLIWLSWPADEDCGAATVRAALDGRGHATLMRAPDSVRAGVPVFQPQPEALARLTARVKDSFDPARILNRGRMYAAL